MAKIKFSKGELKRQRDSLKQYERYLPTLQLKKQQLQIEIVREISRLEERSSEQLKELRSIERWAGLLSDESVNIKRWITPKNTLVTSKNIAGAELPVFDKVEFLSTEYDLFITPLWVDLAIEALRRLVSVRAEIAVLKKGLEILRQELSVTTQRVNLFEKVKIPQANEAIRLIKIYIGDQMANAVGRSKIAKRKIESASAIEVMA